MKKIIKWTLILGGFFLVMVISALLIIPAFVDVGKYKPVIEKKIAEATGRPFILGGDLDLSLFPWAGISFSDLHLGNPPGFEEKDFLSIKSFEARVKLLPLFSKKIQVKCFVLEGPRIVMERNKEGRGNWEGMGKTPPAVSDKAPHDTKDVSTGKSGQAFPINAIDVTKFSVTNGKFLWIDHIKGERNEASNLTLILEDVSLDRPVSLNFSALLDGKSISLAGKVGPIGKEPGKGDIPIDLVVKILKQLEISLRGKITNAASEKRFDLAVGIAPFSPRKLLAGLGQTFTITTANPRVMNLLSLNAGLVGDSQNLSISDGTLELDESKLDFSVKIRDFSQPKLSFDLKLNKIDLDQYLPPAPDRRKKSGGGDSTGKISPSQGKKTDYQALRRLVLDGIVRVGEFKVGGARMEDLYLKLSGKNGRFDLNPLTLKLYHGDISLRGVLDVRQNLPRSNTDIHLKGIKVSPLLQDLMKKDFLEGVLEGNLVIGTTGDDAEKIKASLSGKGDIFLKDGALVGIDLVQMIRNIKTSFSPADKGEELPRTDFGQFHLPFSIIDGIFTTTKTSLKSQLFRLQVEGSADLVKEALDFRVEPKFLAIPPKEENLKKRSEIMIPLRVTGTFSAPKFTPDLKGMLKKSIETGLSDPSKFKEMFRSLRKDKKELKSKEEKDEVSHSPDLL